jgi:ATP-dependent helicase/nuclease subunit B
MPERIFLGYDRPFLHLLTQCLLTQHHSLAETLIIVPTSQSGRLLRESLASSAGALLAPTLTTPGALLKSNDDSIAPNWLEKLAWIEVFSSLSQSDWADYSELLPVPPSQHGSHSDWAISLATEITKLRAQLLEHLHNLHSTSKFLSSSPEAGRWENLARLESLAEKQLFAWGYRSRSEALRKNFQLPEGFQRIVLAGITEMPKCIENALNEINLPVQSVIAAPASEQEHFSPLGIPLQTWANRELPAHASSHIAANPASQVCAALDAISKSKANSNDIALGCPDEITGSILAKALSDKGWPAFHPAAQPPTPSLVRWLTAWREWLSSASSTRLATLLSLPESEALIDANRSQILQSLNSIRDRHASIQPTDVLKKISYSSDESHRALHSAISSLLSQRLDFLNSPFPEAIRTHLEKFALSSESSHLVCEGIENFLSQASRLIPKIKRSHGFWLQVLLTHLPAPTAQPNQDRVIDIQGWLELLFEPSPHLIICGMNETLVPASSGSDPWLSENIRSALGITTDTDRHARDAYLLHCMVMMRQYHGSVQLICGKTDADGNSLLPSRLLLQVPRAKLVSTVKHLFREIEPPESNLIWTRDWQWDTPNIPAPIRINVTSLKDYLACPFRFYLKHVLKMNVPEPDRKEMNAREFGTITHLVLENWAKNPDNAATHDAAKISAEFDLILDQIIKKEFGVEPPLSIRIQAKAIRQRLDWFAQKQAESAADGWEIIAVEKKFELSFREITVSGKIDRIDRHRETEQLRVIDYKTGKIDTIEKNHRQSITAKTKIPAHFPDNGAPFYEFSDAKGKSVRCFWKDLQLPIYALAEKESTQQLPIPTYIQIGKTEKEVRLFAWNDFSEEDLKAAKSCVEWIAGSIQKSVFWPPAEKVSFDDYNLLAPNQTLAEAMIIRQ